MEVTDPTLLEKVSRKRWASDAEGDLVNEQLDDYAHEQIPEELMSQLAELVGDGGANITIGADLTTSIEFGCKAGAFVSVRLTCDNSMEAVEAVHDLVTPWVQSTVEKDYEKMADIRAQALGHTSEEAPSVPSKAKTTAKKPIGMKNKPSFKR